MLSLRLAVLSTILVFAIACGDYSSPPPSPSPTPSPTPTPSGPSSSVVIPVGAEFLGNRAFMPGDLSITVGTTVTWMNTRPQERFRTTARSTREWSERSSFADVGLVRLNRSTTRKRVHMPLFLDVHDHVEGLTADAAREAHQADLKTQEKYHVKYLRFWFAEETGKVFCLIDAPNKEAAIAVHREAHGLVADAVIEVKEGV